MMEPVQSKAFSRAGLIVLLALLGVRFTLAAALAALDPATMAQANRLFFVVTYVVTAGLIWLERRRLPDFHLDGLGLLLFLLAPAVGLFAWKTGLPGVETGPPVGLVNLGMAGLLVITLLVGGFRPPRPAPRVFGWLIIGALAGFGLGLLQGAMAWSMGLHGRVALIPLAVVARLSDELASAVVSEEPVFRGFLWGYLRKAGLSDFQTLLVQAALFWVAHFFQASKGFGVGFFLLIPVGSLVFGFLAWRARSISASMAAHSVVNAIGRLGGL
ncbi:MAG TPA: CPBP family intramembrane glutamic endopeptidase [Bacillota bacterium]|jgi:hypothetical protein